MVRASKNRLNDIVHLKDNDVTILRFAFDDNGDCRTVLEFAVPNERKQAFLQIVYIGKDSMEQDILELLQEEENSIDEETLIEILSRKFTVVRDRRKR